MHVRSVYHPLQLPYLLLQQRTLPLLLLQPQLHLCHLTGQSLVCFLVLLLDGDLLVVISAHVLMFVGAHIQPLVLCEVLVLCLPNLFVCALVLLRCLPDLYQFWHRIVLLLDESLEELGFITAAHRLIIINNGTLLHHLHSPHVIV